jgi:hypothetical protein
VRAPFFAVAALLSVACASSNDAADAGPEQCNDNPWMCTAGTTCWPSDALSHVACLPSKAGAKKGDACIDSFGAATCGDAMACLQPLTTKPGTCVPYCSTSDPAHGCAAGESCLQGHLGSASGPVISLCVPATDGGAGDAASDAPNDAPSG